MKRYLIPLLLLLFLPAVSHAMDSPNVLLVGNTHYRPYELAIEGFTEACNCRISTMTSESQNERDILRFALKIKADIIVAVGGEALEQIANIKKIPIFSIMALTQKILEQKTIPGISIDVPPLNQLKVMRQIFPQFTRIGVFYDPANSSSFLREAQKAAEELGVTLYPVIVKSPLDVPEALRRIKKKVDIFWMIPEPSYLTKETLGTLFEFSIAEKLPILTFSGMYVELGATIAVSTDPRQMGEQAARVVNKIVAGNNGHYSGVIPEGSITTLNLQTIRQLNITVTLDNAPNTRFVK